LIKIRIETVKYFTRVISLAYDLYNTIGFIYDTIQIWIAMWHVDMSHNRAQPLLQSDLYVAYFKQR